MALFCFMALVTIQVKNTQVKVKCLFLHTNGLFALFSILKVRYVQVIKIGNEKKHLFDNVWPGTIHKNNFMKCNFLNKEVSVNLTSIESRESLDTK